MGKKRTEHSTYPSPYSPGSWVRPDQYAIEIICLNKAKAEQKELPIKFWETKEWGNYFRSQLRQCRKLFKQYGEVPVIRAITKNPKGKRCWSLHAKWLLPIIEEEARKYAAEQEAIKNAPKVEYERLENPTVAKKKFKSKLLEDLD